MNYFFTFAFLAFLEVALSFDGLPFLSPIVGATFPFLSDTFSFLAEAT